MQTHDKTPALDSDSRGMKVSSTFAANVWEVIHHHPSVHLKFCVGDIFILYYTMIASHDASQLLAGARYWASDYSVKHHRIALLEKQPQTLATVKLVHRR